MAFVPRLALRQAGRRPDALVSSLDACLALGGFALFFGWPDLTKTLRLPGALTKLGPEQQSPPLNHWTILRGLDRQWTGVCVSVRVSRVQFHINTSHSPLCLRQDATYRQSHRNESAKRLPASK